MRPDAVLGASRVVRNDDGRARAVDESDDPHCPSTSGYHVGTAVQDEDPTRAGPWGAHESRRRRWSP